jgi:hypothetical protein
VRDRDIKAQAVAWPTAAGVVPSRTLPSGGGTRGVNVRIWLICSSSSGLTALPGLRRRP